MAMEERERARTACGTPRGSPASQVLCPTQAALHDVASLLCPIRRCARRENTGLCCETAALMMMMMLLKCYSDTRAPRA